MAEDVPQNVYFLRPTGRIGVAFVSQHGLPIEMVYYLKEALRMKRAAVNSKCHAVKPPRRNLGSGTIVYNSQFDL